MEAVESQRTLVKSMPELWAELSEAALLDRLLHEPFGEIRITRLEPESSIEWESELAAGSVELEPSGFGTRVRLRARLPEPQLPEPPPPRRLGLLARLFRRPAAPAPLAPEPPTQAPALDPSRAEGALRAVLDEIATPRHRPFSRHV